MARRPALAFIFVTLFLDILGIGIVVPILPKLVEQLHGGGTDSAALIYGLLVALYCLAQFLCAPLLGSLSDKVGRRPVILFALLGAGLDYFLLAWAPTLTWFFLGRIISGVTGANFSAATAYIADVSPPEKRAANFALVGAAFGLGFAIGPAIGGLLGGINLRLPFIVAGSLTLVSWLYGLLILPESLKPENRRPFSWNNANPFRSLRGLGRSKLILGLSLSLLIVNIAHYVYQSVWVLYTAHRYEWTTVQIGGSLAFVGVMAMIMQGFVGRKLMPALGEKRTMFLGIAAMALSMLGYGLSPSGWMVYPIIVLGSVGGFVTPAMQGLLSRSVGDDEQGWIQGMVTSLQSLAGIVAPPVLTAIFGYFISEKAPVYLPGAAFFFGVALLIVAASVAFSAQRS
ncbi:MAG: TCR/Tet family MFS transporter [Verrucomicrobiota bacterium]